MIELLRCVNRVGEEYESFLDGYSESDTTKRCVSAANPYLNMVSVTLDKR